MQSIREYINEKNKKRNEQFLNTFARVSIKKTSFNTKELSVVASPCNQAGSAAAIVRRIFL